VYQYVCWPYTGLFFYIEVRVYVCSLITVSAHVFPLLPVFLSRSRTRSLLLRLNSRDRIRAKLAADVESGIVTNPLVFTPGPNLSTGRDTTQGGTGVAIDIVAGVTDQNLNTVEPSSEKVRLL